jgi:hypothetical protein
VRIKPTEKCAWLNDLKRNDDEVKCPSRVNPEISVREKPGRIKIN